MDYDVSGALAEVSQQADLGADQPTAEPSVSVEQEPMFDLKWGGETKQFPKSKVIDYAQQGFDYNKKMSDLNQQRRLYEAEQKKFEENRSQFQERFEYLDQVDKYAQQNPAWLQAVQQAYAQATGQPVPGQAQQADQANPFAGHVHKLDSRLTELETMLKSQREQDQIKRQAEEDARLDELIGEYKSTHKDFDWQTVDPATGQTLEQKILNHAVENGIQNFRAAANDYLHDEFIKRASGRGKEAVANDLKQKSILGLGPKTDRPLLGIKHASNTHLSYEQLAAQALSELGG